LNECVNHTAHGIGWHKVVQHHWKQRCLISPLALDVTQKAFAKVESEVVVSRGEGDALNETEESSDASFLAGEDGPSLCSAKTQDRDRDEDLNVAEVSKEMMGFGSLSYVGV